MILTAHILVGASIGIKFHSYGLVFFLALLSHFLMDALPHCEYKVEKLKEKFNRDSLPDLLKGLLDLTSGNLIALLFIWNSPFKTYAFLGIISALLPDGLSGLYWQTRSPFLKKITEFHRVTIHPKDNKNTPLIWGIGIQLIIIIVAIFVLFYHSPLLKSFTF